MTTDHACQPPYLARTGRCDCSRCCAAAPHEAGCLAVEPTAAPECTCPPAAQYHRPGCPEYDDDPAFAADYPALAAWLRKTPEERAAADADLRARLDELDRLMQDAPVPPDGRPLTDWEREHMIPAEASEEVDYGHLDDADPVWVRLPHTP